MKGRLIQINNVDGDSIGLWYTEDETVTDEFLIEHFRNYDGSDDYDENGIDGFEDYLRDNTSKEIERVFVEEIDL